MTNFACFASTPHVAAMIAGGYQPGSDDEAWWTLWQIEKSEGISPISQEGNDSRRHHDEKEPWQSHQHNKNSRARRRWQKAREKRHFH